MGTYSEALVKEHIRDPSASLLKFLINLKLANLWLVLAYLNSQFRRHLASLTSTREPVGHRRKTILEGGGQIREKTHT